MSKDRKFASWDEESSKRGSSHDSYSVTSGARGDKLFNTTPMFASEGWPVFVALDGTGSMGSWVRNLQENLKRLFDESKSAIPNAYFSFGIINDHCDGADRLLQVSPFGCGCELLHFIDCLRGAGGGDGPEAYELYAKYVVEAVKGQVGTIYKPIVVILGDAIPHSLVPKEDSGGIPNKYQINAEKIFKELGELTHLVFIATGMNSGYGSHMKKLIKDSNGDYIDIGSPKQAVPNIVKAIATIMKREGVFNKSLVPTQPKRENKNIRKRIHSFGS